ncbi:MAG: YkgJ family cysteine cluster protein [Nitrospirae bacterium]|nr:YkgJ family cysteine cluster protein [Nitrospirota bacterium]
MLLNAYHILDNGVACGIESELKRGRKLACERGCTNCCIVLKDIPFYPLEIIGISWYAAEKMSGPEREILKTRLKYHKKNDPCPFLIESACSIYLMRPMACRQFNVFGKPCAKGEDPYYTRIEDVLPPVKKFVDQAFFIMLPFYGVEKESDRVKAIESGAMHKTVKVLQECNWKLLAERMEQFDTTA